MSVVRVVAHAVALTARTIRAVVTGTVVTGRFVGRRLSAARARGGAGEAGMMRLLDVQAASVAGDTLAVWALAGVVLFAVPVDEARDRMAWCLLVTMAPVALAAPVLGPALDRFRHGRRYALAVTMLGRAVLAWMVADIVAAQGRPSVVLFLAAFGMVALSRMSAVIRAAVVPRLLPAGRGLVETGARASLFGVFVGVLVVPLALGLGYAGFEWILRGAALLFAVGTVAALRLPPRDPVDPPETVPALFRLPGRRRAGGGTALSGRLVVVATAGSVALRVGYGFVTLFVALRVAEGDLLPWVRNRPVIMGMVIGAFVAGSVLAAAVLARMRITRPLVLQSVASLAVTGAAAAATASYGLWPVALLCLVTASASAAATLTVDAVIAERVPARVQASAFAHVEILAMLAWVVGAGLGLVPLSGPVGLGTVAAVAAVATVGLAVGAARLRTERLTGTAPDDVAADQTDAVGGTGDDSPRPVVRDATPDVTDADEPRRSGGAVSTASDRDAQPGNTRTTVTAPVVPPGFHVYRPSNRRRGPGT